MADPTPAPWTVHHFVDEGDLDYKPHEQGLYEIEEANEQINDLRRDGEVDEALAVAEANRALIQAAPELEARVRELQLEWTGMKSETLLAQARVRELEADLDKAIFGGKLRRCDIPACNCNGYHSHYAMRMMEEADKVRELEAELKRTVNELGTGWDGAQARVRELEAEVKKLLEVMP